MVCPWHELMEPGNVVCPRKVESNLSSASAWRPFQTLSRLKSGIFAAPNMTIVLLGSCKGRE